MSMWSTLPTSRQADIEQLEPAAIDPDRRGFSFALAALAMGGVGTLSPSFFRACLSVGSNGRDVNPDGATT
jgi:hypothetical protein